MSYHPRIEHPSFGWLVTTRSRNSRLWFVNNKRLDEAVLGYAAKYAERYSVKLYALAIEGNHIHTVSQYPECNRADFMRDFNSGVARSVERLVADYDGGLFWGRRYSAEILPDPQDIEAKFFYAVLQPVQDGLVERISEYPGYNCFHDAIYGIERWFEVVDWGAYNAAKVRNRAVPVRNYTYEVKLRYERLPGYEHLSQREYAALMLKKLELRRSQIVNERKAEGKGFLGRELLLQIKAGALPLNTKTSTEESFRPRVIAGCPKRRAEVKIWYFTQQALYRAASKRYRAGEWTVEFPPGMYRPYLKPPP